MAISRRLRFEILRRDGHTCRYCGDGAPDVKLTVDHVTPVALGGKDEATNLVTACQPCNSGKTSTTPDAPLVEDVTNDALRWAAAIHTAAETRRSQRRPVIDAQQRFADQWGWQWWPDNWEDAIERFILNGLDGDDLAFILAKAHRRCSDAEHTFLWFCKVAWAEISELQDVARATVTAGDNATPPPGPTLTPTEEELTEAYVQGYAQGRSDALSVPTLEPGPHRTTLCIECDNAYSYDGSGQCARCWDQQMGVAV